MNHTPTKGNWFRFSLGTQLSAMVIVSIACCLLAGLLAFLDEDENETQVYVLLDSSKKILDGDLDHLQVNGFLSPVVSPPAFLDSDSTKRWYTAKGLRAVFVSIEDTGSRTRVVVFVKNMGDEDKLQLNAFLLGLRHQVKTLCGG